MSVVVLALSVGSLVGCSPLQSPTPARAAIPSYDVDSVLAVDGSALVGTLVDSASGRGMRNGQVRLVASVDSSSVYAISDDNGGFVLPHLRPGRYRILVRSIGYHPWLGERILKANKVDTLNLRLSRSVTCGGIDCQ